MAKPLGGAGMVTNRRHYARQVKHCIPLARLPISPARDAFSPPARRAFFSPPLHRSSFFSPPPRGAWGERGRGVRGRPSGIDVVPPQSAFGASGPRGYFTRRGGRHGLCVQKPRSRVEGRGTVVARGG